MCARRPSCSDNLLDGAKIDLSLSRARHAVDARPADGGVAGARAFVMNFEEGETTGIITMSDVRSEMSDGWYTIDGRKLSGKPSVKGVYVNNGRKVIIK